MGNESLKSRVKRLEDRVPVVNSEAEAILELLKRVEVEGLNRRMTNAERAALKEFLDSYPFERKRGVKV